MIKSTSTRNKIENCPNVANLRLVILILGFSKYSALSRYYFESEEYLYTDIRIDRQGMNM